LGSLAAPSVVSALLSAGVVIAVEQKTGETNKQTNKQTNSYLRRIWLIKQQNRARNRGKIVSTHWDLPCPRKAQRTNLGCSWPTKACMPHFQSNCCRNEMGTKKISRLHEWKKKSKKAAVKLTNIPLAAHKLRQNLDSQYFCIN
jgi:hypothetical protein